MFCLCKKFFKDDHAALEAVNDGMMKVFRNLVNYKTGQGEFFNWVYTIVRNTALDKLKVSVQYISYDVEEYDTPDTGKNIIAKLEWKDIYRYLDHLPPATRPVFSLFYLEDYSIMAIAAQLQITEGTVKWHLSESRKIMQPVLKKHFLI
jgi:RNA polymerase sigma-70 factor (ECF subfamily)